MVALPEVTGLDEQAMLAAWQRTDRLTKPRGSLGRLEDLGVWLAGVQGRAPPEVRSKTIFVVAADHGVAVRGVSAYPQSVTGEMVKNFLRGGAAINVLARQAGARVVVVDAGVIEDPRPPRRGRPSWGARNSGGAPAFVSRRIGAGTRDFLETRAMSPGEAQACIRGGIELALAEGADVIGCGEMGIGNTTAAAAISAAVLGCPPEEVTGRGTGIDDDARARKVAVIEGALALHRPDPSDPLDILSKVGGFEIGVLAGIIVGAASARCAVLIDGFISTAAALLAAGLAPACRSYMLASHLSTEPGHRRALAHLRLSPLLDLNLRLGEGTGAALAMQVVDAAWRLMSEMATFEEAGVSDREGPD